MDQLRGLGIKDEQVLAGINAVPRHLFLESSFLEHAYQNKAFPIAAGQTISHPFTVAFQTELLEFKPGQRILEIGTGSGYQCAVLLEMGAQIYTIERQNALYKRTGTLFRKLNYRPKKYVFGDGYAGLPEDAPFDGIIVTCGATELPKKLMGQLKVGGRLVVPIGSDPQIMHLLIKTAEDSFSQETFGEFRFVPFLTGKN